MPKLSSAETPPEKSSDCLPVSTIALSGVMTRMPLVCISIVASAFQYGWAPTLMPATTTLTSPPSWVNVTIRCRARATQSMFSVPESIEIRAPAESANHSTGTDIRSARSSAAMIRGALGLGHRAQGLGGVAEQHHAGDALGVPLGDGGRDARDDAGGVVPGLAVDRGQRAGRVEVVLDEGAAGPGQHAG